MMTIFRRTPFHPFLIAIYPILYLLSQNIDEMQPLTALRSLLIPLVIAIILFLIFWAICRNYRQAALITSFWVIALFILVFFVYAPVYLAIEKKIFFGVNIGRHRNLIILIAIILTVCSWFIAKKIRESGNLTLILNLTALVLVIFPLLQIGITGIRSSNTVGDPAQSVLQGSHLSPPANQSPPDVYYIILDMYTRADVLKGFFKLDTLPFQKKLEDKGFYIANCSQSNYHTTWLSITSSLNMNYLSDMGLSVDTPMAPYLHHSAVRKALESMGYSTVAFETGYSVTDIQDVQTYLAPFNNPMAALTYGGINSFEAMILNNSAGVLVYMTLKNQPWQTQTFFNTPYVQYRERILFELDHLDTITALPGPKFVFAHILAPHDPFVFDQDGNFVHRDHAFTMTQDQEYDDDTYAVAYAAELTYINKRIEVIVDNILANSKTPPIIIIQGDHGAPRTAKYAQNFDIFNAYYLPGDGSKALYPTISPVNSFRIVFNQYFNGNFSLLPDTSYNNDKDTQQFSRMTDLPCGGNN
jgi:hypothetical protein